MNSLGHVAVALALGHRDDGFALGAALPDLASMVGARLDRSLLAGPVADGVTCHLAADTAFHDLPAFREGAAALRRDLAAAGLATGPRRAVGHAGWELLLDGALLGGEVEAAYRAGVARAGEVSGAIAPAGRARWARLAAGGPPPVLRYDDPGWVADRLEGALAHRPRLALPPGGRDAAAEILAGHARAVRESAPAVVAAVAERVRLASAAVG